MIRRILMASAGAFALTGAAFAADLPRARRRRSFCRRLHCGPGSTSASTPDMTWSASTGHQHRNGESVFPRRLERATSAARLPLSRLATIALAPSGFVGGGQIGYNYQFANSWVAGLEADFDGIAGAHRVRFLSANGIRDGPVSADR